MQLKKFVMIEAPAIEDCVARSYDSDFKRGMIDDVLKATDNGSRINPLTMAKIASRIISPIGESIKANIDGGWQGERFKVAMVVEIEEHRYSSEYMYVVGYTDGGMSDRTSRISGNVKIDPEMKIYFNSMTKIDFKKMNYRDREVWQPKLNRTNQLLRRDSVSNSRNSRERPGLLRPMDLYRRRDIEISDHQALDSIRNNPNIQMDNTTGCFVSPIIFNDQTNNLSTGHLNRSFNALVNAAGDVSNAISGNMDESTMLSGALDRLDEYKMEDDPMLSQMRRDTDIMRSGYITYGELLDASPNWHDDDSIVKAFDVEQEARYRDTERWNGSSPEQIAAVIIANGLPSIMMQSMYSMANRIVIDTEAKLGQSPVVCQMPYPFIEGIDPMSTLAYFEETVGSILVKDATNGGLMDIYAEIDANLDEEIEINISVDNGPMTRFVYPAWASGLLAPVLATDQTTLDRLSRSITSLATDIATARNAQHGTHVDSPGIVTGISGINMGREREARDSRSGGRGRASTKSYSL